MQLAFVMPKLETGLWGIARGNAALDEPTYILTLDEASSGLEEEGFTLHGTYAFPNKAPYFGINALLFVKIAPRSELNVLDSS